MDRALLQHRLHSHRGVPVEEGQGKWVPSASLLVSSRSKGIYVFVATTFPNISPHPSTPPSRSSAPITSIYATKPITHHHLPARLTMYPQDSRQAWQRLWPKYLGITPRVSLSTRTSTAGTTSRGLNTLGSAVNII